MKKRILTGLIAAVLLISSISVSASAGFSDVKESDWFYSQVMAMTETGLFAGKGEIVNGVGTFAPNDTMTKAEFITVVARMFYKDDALNNYVESSDKWWDKYYNACVAKGVFSEYEVSYNTMEEGIAREEMAFISERALDKIGDKAKVSYQMDDAPNVIPDYNNISSHLRSFVVKAYADGILCGVDDAGNFAPKDTLTRAEASTVLYRIVESDARTPNTQLGVPIGSGGLTGGNTVVEDLSQPITIYEGQTRYNRIAKEGDTFVKADGTKVVLKLGPNGILGEGQGVAPDIGLKDPNGSWTVKNGVQFGYWGYGNDSAGFQTGNSAYLVNPLTGEGHWAGEWTTLLNATDPTKQGIKGTKRGEITADKNFVWIETLGGMWMRVVHNPDLVGY